MKRIMHFLTVFLVLFLLVPQANAETSSTSYPWEDTTKENIEIASAILEKCKSDGSLSVNSEESDFIDSKVELFDEKGKFKYYYNPTSKKIWMEWESDEAVGDIPEIEKYLSELYGEAITDDDGDCSWNDMEEYAEVLLIKNSDDTISVSWVSKLTYKTANSNTKKCVECGKEAYKSYKNPFSGEYEDYCKTHYDEIMEIFDMMETDVGKGSASRHTCEVCSKEGTRTILGFSGKTEYYCTQHYQEMKDLMDYMGLDW